jgi:hypothetical protein
LYLALIVPTKEENMFSSFVGTINAKYNRENNGNTY